MALLEPNLAHELLHPRGSNGSGNRVRPTRRSRVPTMPRFTKHLWMIVLALTALVVLFAPASQAAGPRLTVQMDEPFEINGTLFPPGELSVRPLGDYNPVTSLNEIRVDGKLFGIVMGQRAKSHAAVPDDALVFRRSDRGHLELHSIALKGESPHELLPATQQPTDMRAASLKGTKRERLRAPP